MIASFYGALLALLIVWLSLRVIKLRQSKKIGLGDGGETQLQIAIRAQGNATEYIPISLILLLLLELNKAYIPLIHIAGIVVVISRLLHARGLITSNITYRVLGMQLTLFALIGLAFANIGYVIYGLLPK
jgi:uncharacterized membrane protein YecN with MAPEG domain